jgi:hypothetical protein
MLAVADRWTRLFAAGRASRATAELRGMFEGLRGQEPLVEPSQMDLTGTALTIGEKS